MFFFILCCFEKIYCFVFHFNQMVRRKRGGYVVPFGRVIAVGNLTTGGTGKSVVVSFLVHFLGAQSCAIISRGYGRSIEAGNENVMVCDGTSLLVDVTQAGDEAYMLACDCCCPVVVGADRKKSCELLAQKLSHKPRHILLDDAYQNHQLKKDIEILLLDARAPFDNGHCLPAGRLREKDYRRATIILLTHADCVDHGRREYIKRSLLSDFDYERIFSVKHAFAGFFGAGAQKVERQLLRGAPMLVVAGIGSFNGFVTSVVEQGVRICHMLEFPDHHMYREADVQTILSLIRTNQLRGALTTAKDWCKIKKFLTEAERSNFFVAAVSVEFLAPQEYSQFVGILKKKSC